MLPSMEIPTSEPTSLTAGDTVRWTRELSDYPADQYQLKYVLQPISGGTPIAVTASASGSLHAVTLSAATTADYAAGDYRWFSYCVDNATGLERYSIDSGALAIAPDPTDFSTTTDLRSHARKVLDAIEATLEGTASSDQLMMTVDGDQLQKYQIGDLLTLRSTYAAEVAREKQAEAIARGLGGGNRILTRFV